MQDRDDKYQAEDEYHFSDDEVNYELDESNSASSGEQPPTQGGGGIGGIAKIAKSRLVISLVAFLGLMFVVYKMVSPTGSSDLSTDIGPQVAAPAQPAVRVPAATPQPTQAQAQQQPANAQQQLAQMQQTAQQPAVAPQQLQQPAAAPQQQVPTQQQAVQQQTYQQPAVPQQQSAPQQPANNQLAAIQAQAMKDLNTMMQSHTASAQSAQTPQQPVNQSAYAMQQQQQYNAMQQQVQQYQQQAPMSPEQVQKLAIARQTGADHQRSVSQNDMRAQQLIAENARLSQDMKASYEQRIAEYKNQTSNLQSEIKDLNTRVAGMESEMTQLIRTLTHQFQDGNTGNAQPAQERAAPAPKIPYSVQAIIPGRAWLRSNSGDTVTVTEGDQIKGVGQVTRIDPYGGVVEIDVRGRKVSLSYGGGR